MKAYAKSVNSKQVTISVLAIMKIIAGLLLLLIFGGISFAEHLVGFFFDPAISFMGFLGGFFLFFVIWLTSAGIIDLMRLRFAGDLEELLEKSPQTVNTISQLMGKSTSSLLKKVSILKNKNFYHSVVLLEDCVVFERSENARPLMLMAEKSMRFDEAKSSRLDAGFIAFAIALVAGADYAALRIAGSNLIATAISLAIAAVIFLIKKPTPKLLYKSIPVREIIIEMPNSGNEAADELIELAATHIRELNSLDLAIEDEHLSMRLQEIIMATQQLIEFLRKNPHKNTQAKQLVDYALPTAIKLLKQYEYLSDQPVKGDNISRSMKKIEEMSDSLSATMRRELDALYADGTIDIEVDVEVMGNMLNQEEIGINLDYGHNRK